MDVRVAITSGKHVVLETLAMLIVRQLESRAVLFLALEL
jgi:hypothetical protein